FLVLAAACGPAGLEGAGVPVAEPVPPVEPPVERTATPSRGPAGGPTPRGARELPNVLLVVTDDQPVGTFEVMPEVRRWFIEGGTLFTSAYATTPLCCPARASILTGRYAHNHRIVTNDGGETLSLEAALPGILQGIGYRTAISGKLFNDWPLEVDPAFFDRWAMFNVGYHQSLWNLDGQVRRVDEYSTDFAADRAVEFLRAFEHEDQRPWFVLVAPFAPHGPFEPAPRYAAAEVPRWAPERAVTEPNRSDKPPYVRERTAKPWATRTIRARQLRTLMSVDDLVGRLMRSLGSLGERDRTLAVYVSDNGFLWGQHGIVDGKRFPYLPSVQVPMAVRWPGHLAAGAVDDRLAANVDLAPTVLRAAGFSGAAVQDLDGRSLLDPGTRSRLLLEYWADPTSSVPTWASVLTPDRQYIEYHGAGGRTVAFREYYDLQADPLQLRNLLGDADPRNDPSAWRLARLSSRLARDRGCQGSAGPTACP
ncbi:MAG TPA: sulfatase, partial [Actinomycetota bacterium]|nr:sulfatase [Actinomycetota bacterium]